MVKKNTWIVIIITLLTIIVFSVLGHKKTKPETSQITQNSDPITEAAFTVEEAGRHNSSNDCYLIIKGEVYDVSSYISQHPGGRRNITSRCGTEVSGIFASIHSNFAWNLLKNYYVGAIGNTTQTTTNLDALDSVKQKLQQQYPEAEILSVKPSNDNFIAKMIYKNQLYEVHLDSSGKITKQEVANDEFDWGAWDSDSDDL